MHDDLLASPEAFLSRISRRLDVISSTMHRLASERSLLREQATRLRLGVPAAEVRAVLDHCGVLLGFAGGASAPETASRQRDRRPRATMLVRALMATPHGLVTDVTGRTLAEVSGIGGG